MNVRLYKTRTLLNVVILVLSMLLLFTAYAVIESHSYATDADADGGTIKIVYKEYIDNNGTLEEVPASTETIVDFSKVDDSDQDIWFADDIETSAGTVNMSRLLSVRQFDLCVKNIFGGENTSAPLEISKLPAGRYKLSVSGDGRVGENAEYANNVEGCEYFLDLQEGEERTIYCFTIMNKERYSYFQMSDGSWYSFHFRPKNITLRGDLRKYLDFINNASSTVEKEWEGEEAKDSVKVRLRWKLDYEEHADRLDEAIKVKGVDEATIIEIMSQYMQVNGDDRKILTDELMKACMAGEVTPLDVKFKNALIEHLRGYILATLHNQNIYNVDSLVSADKEGYCYVDLTLAKAEDWSKVLEKVILPNDLEVVELTSIPGNKMTWTIESKGNTIQQIVSSEWIADPDGAYYNAATNEMGTWNHTYKEVPDPFNNVGKVTIINKCPPVDHTVKATEKPKEAKETNTGDESNLPLWIIVFAISGIAGAGLAFARKRRRC